MSSGKKATTSRSGLGGATCRSMTAPRQRHVPLPWRESDLLGQSLQHPRVEREQQSQPDWPACADGVPVPAAACDRQRNGQASKTVATR